VAPASGWLIVMRQPPAVATAGLPVTTAVVVVARVAAVVVAPRRVVVGSLLVVAVVVAVLPGTAVVTVVDADPVVAESPFEQPVASMASAARAYSHGRARLMTAG